jgi:DivIVA domain-containing protein
VTDVALAVLGLPEALCYFNPNGEVLRDREGTQESLAYARSNELLPLDLWSNVRLFNIGGGWSLMDTVGNAQFDQPDIEACFSRGYDCGEVDRFLRNATWYLYQNGEIVKDGDTMDGPGAVRWQAKSFENGLTEPPRRVLSWLPLDEVAVPQQLRER